MGTEGGEKVTEGQTERQGERRLHGQAGRKATESEEKGVNLGRGEAHGFGRNRAQTELSFGRQKTPPKPGFKCRIRNGMWN